MRKKELNKETHKKAVHWPIFNYCLLVIITTNLIENLIKYKFYRIYVRIL